VPSFIGTRVVHLRLVNLCCWVLRDGRGPSRGGRVEHLGPENAGGDHAGRRHGHERGSCGRGTRSDMEPSCRLSDVAEGRSGSAASPQSDVPGFELGIERRALARERLPGHRCR